LIIRFKVFLTFEVMIAFSLEEMKSFLVCNSMDFFA
jgi:hypothetical protein